MENMERRRFDSMESWSMILDSENVETWEVSKEDQEEWTADLSQLFIGNKFASGAHSRIYRGIYKQRAVAVKMVRIPNQKDETRTFLEQQFKSEVALLSRLFHPNIVQVTFHAKVRKKLQFSTIIIILISIIVWCMYIKLFSLIFYCLSNSVICSIKTSNFQGILLSSSKPLSARIPEFT
jgi:serine/threonine protein kinase